MFIECLRLAALSEGVITLDDSLKLPIYLRRKILERYETERENENNNGYKVTNKNE